MKQVLDRILQHFIADGQLQVRWPDGTTSLYKGRNPGPSAGVVLHNQAAVRAMVINPGLGFGEAYMDSHLDPLDCTLYNLLDVLMLNAMRPGGHVAERLASALRYVRRSPRMICRARVNTHRVRPPPPRQTQHVIQKSTPHPLADRFRKQAEIRKVYRLRVCQI